MGERLRWGILGTGNIARQFATGVNSSQRGVIAAVGSRSAVTAEAFAKMFQIPSALGSYEALVRSSEVDAVYVSLPNSMHHEWTLAALAAGKHVLCEKPIASNAAQAEEMFEAARRAGKVLMEAFMYRSHPQTLAVQEKVRSGAIGDLKLIRTSFCFRTSRVGENIRFSRDLAGGALMDIGCYCVNFARLFAGAEPESVFATGHIHDSGVDDVASAILRFPGGVISTFTCGMTLQADNAAALCGSEGYIEIPVPWKPLRDDGVFTVARSTPPRMDNVGKAPPTAPPRQTYTVECGADLYAVEADDFAAAAMDGAMPRVDARDSIGNMRVLDELRRQVGFAF